MEAVSQPDSFEAYKRMAGEQAVELIQSGNEFHHFAMISNVY